MITGEYIIEFVGIDSEGADVGSGNYVISKTNFSGACEFYTYVKDGIIKDCPQISNIRIVGVFKL